MNGSIHSIIFFPLAFSLTNGFTDNYLLANQFRRLHTALFSHSPVQADFTYFTEFVYNCIATAVYLHSEAIL